MCDLIEGRGLFFDLLNEESIFPNGSDGSLFNKLKANLGRRQEFVTDARAGAGRFEICHYAGRVKYETAGMLEKNKDTLFGDLVELMKGSSNPVAASLFQPKAQIQGGAGGGRAVGRRPSQTAGGGRGGGGKAKKWGAVRATVGGAAGFRGGGVTKRPDTTCVQYKKSMKELMATLKAAEQHYVIHDLFATHTHAHACTHTVVIVGLSSMCWACCYEATRHTTSLYNGMQRMDVHAPAELSLPGSSNVRFGRSYTFC